MSRHGKHRPEWYLENRERIVQQSRDYYLKNKEKVDTRVKEYAKNHLEINRKAVQRYNERHPNIKKAQYIARRIPLKKYCELCSEDDVKLATRRHHPDYDYPKIFLSVCRECHRGLGK